MSVGEFPVVGIGASAGGIEAFHSFFERMPAHSGMAFILLLHLPAEHKSMLCAIIARWTSMPVVEPSDGTVLEPDTVYVPAPHAVVSLTGRTLRIQPPLEDSDRLYRPIDGFFDSLGAALGQQAVGIVMSGTGSDGALGLKAIKECGGLTIAQGSHGTSPQYAEMPAGAIATGAIDIVASAEQMPGQLMRLKALKPLEVPGQTNKVDDARQEICAILRGHLGHDFSEYRAQSFLRRVARRMQVLNIGDISDYVSQLKADPAEITLLFRDLLIRVTSFFRDEETFAALASEVVPRLFEGKMADGAVRVWAPGCSTGEEAYSLAMLMREHMDTLSVVPKVQIFATDIDPSAIATARLGRYPRTLLQGLSQERLRRFFTFSHGGQCIAKELRRLCTFSVHDLVRDPPFSMMNLVSCRNLLIYMNPRLQSRMIPVFHYSLVPGGILLLGSAESVAQRPELFDIVDKAAHIFRRREGRTPDLDLRWHRPLLPLFDALGPQWLSRSEVHGTTSAEGSSGTNTERALHATDVPNELMPLDNLMGAVSSTPEVVGQLQRALAGTCEQLRSLGEEHQSALEELRSANEELHSVNEELQSTNEEIETSKEELQSLNEEMHTVNLRLTEKIDELDRSNTDLRNLFDSTEIATVFLDRHLVIRSFTPAIANLYNLIPSDHGRPMTDIAGRLQYTTLREDVEYVLSRLEPLERRVVRSDLAAHYVMRILPYREPDSAVSGVLVTFIDVTSIVRAEEALVAADVRKDVFLATLSHELRNPLAPIRIAAQLLQSSKLSAAELRKSQLIIARQVTHMSALLDDLLDVSRITRGAFLLKRAYVDVQVLLDDAAEAVRSAGEQRRHTLRVEGLTAPLILEVDPIRITQVITNLLTNAVKYTPPGGLIELGVRREPHHLVIFVRDNGIGLRAEAVDRIFDMFTRVDSGVRNSEGGLGIGLALARGLVELHGGRLKAHSAGPGQGSEFLVCLPSSLVVESPSRVANAAGESATRANPRRILVADDNRDAAETMGMLLRTEGHEVHIAHTGSEALEVAERVRPEIALLDIGMPDLDGYDVAERLRHEAWGKDMTLIAVTGWGQDADKRRSRAAGFNQHVTKPVDPVMIAGMLRPVTPLESSA